MAVASFLAVRAVWKRPSRNRLTVLRATPARSARSAGCQPLASRSCRMSAVSKRGVCCIAMQTIRPISCVVKRPMLPSVAMPLAAPHTGVHACRGRCFSRSSGRSFGSCGRSGGGAFRRRSGSPKIENYRSRSPSSPGLSRAGPRIPIRRYCERSRRSTSCRTKRWLGISSRPGMTWRTAARNLRRAPHPTTGVPWMSDRIRLVYSRRTIGSCSMTSPPTPPASSTLPSDCSPDTDSPRSLGDKLQELAIARPRALSVLEAVVDKLREQQTKSRLARR
jgi:hypothetical protein